MLRLLRLVSCVLVFVAASAAPSDLIRLEAIDISPPGTPVRLWGRIEFSEAIVGEALRTTFNGGELSGHNQSQKTIVTLVVRTERASEKTTDISQPEHDWFFSYTAFAPGAQHRLQSFGGTIEVMPYSGTTKPLNAQLTFEVVYAQFEDGSEFGQRRHALELLAARKQAVEHLRKLDEILERTAKRHSWKRCESATTNTASRPFCASFVSATSGRVSPPLVPCYAGCSGSRINAARHGSWSFQTEAAQLGPKHRF